MTTSDRYDHRRQHRRGQPERRTVLGRSPIFTPEVINDIHMKAELGRYRMRGFSMFKKIPHWDDLMFMPGTLTRFVIEGYREKCETKTVLGAVREEPDRARHPRLHHRHELRRALARGEDGAREGRVHGRDGDVLGRGRDDPAGARPLDEVVLPVHPEPVRVQPAPPDARGRLRVLHRPGLQGRPRRPPDGPEGHRAGGRDAPLLPGIDQRSPAASRLARAGRPSKIQEIREATDYQIPIQLKLGAARVYDDVRMAAKCGPDIIYLDGAEGGTGAGPHIATEETGIPLMAAIPEARRALEDVGLADEIDLVVAGGIRNGGDVAKALSSVRRRWPSATPR